MKLILFCAFCLILPPIVKVAQAYSEPNTIMIGVTQSATTTAPVPPIPKPSTPEQVETRIRELAALRGFKWTDYLVRLAKCESGLRTDVKGFGNNRPAISTDRGLFQINDYWHAEVSDAVAFDLDLSTNWTMWRIENGYQHEWTCDRIINPSRYSK